MQARKLMNTFRLKPIALGVFSVAAIAVAGTLASGEVIKIVSPSAFANVEGESAVVPSVTPINLLRLYPTSDFADLPESQRWLVAFNHRGDEAQTSAVDWVFPDTEIWVSTTSKTRDTMSTVFSENH